MILGRWTYIVVGGLTGCTPIPGLSIFYLLFFVSYASEVTERNSKTCDMFEHECNLKMCVEKIGVSIPSPKNRGHKTTYF